MRDGRGLGQAEAFDDVRAVAQAVELFHDRHGHGRRAGAKEVEEIYGGLFNDKRENWESLVGDVEFKDVTFYYKDNEIILNNFNLKVKAGQSVALVGHTGSGKTTLINLLARFYEPKEGYILIDGKDYRERRSEERRVGKECRSRWSPYH